MAAATSEWPVSYPLALCAGFEVEVARWGSSSLQHSLMEDPGMERPPSPEQHTHGHFIWTSWSQSGSPEIFEDTNQEEILLIAVNEHSQTGGGGIQPVRSAVQIQEGGGVEHSIHLRKQTHNDGFSLATLQLSCVVTSAKRVHYLLSIV